MSRTFRSYPWSYFRNPKGAKQAESAIEADGMGRKKAIPPDAWEDIPPSRETRIPYEVAKKLQGEGKNREETIRILRRRFGYSFEEAREVTRWLWRK